MNDARRSEQFNRIVTDSTHGVISDGKRLLSDQPVVSKAMTDHQFLENLRTILWLIYTAKDEDKAEIAVEHAIERIWSTMTRNSRNKQMVNEAVLENASLLNKAFLKDLQAVKDGKFTLDKFIQSEEMFTKMYDAKQGR